MKSKQKSVKRSSTTRTTRTEVWHEVAVYQKQRAHDDVQITTFTVGLINSLGLEAGAHAVGGRFVCVDAGAMEYVPAWVINVCNLVVGT
ncbi:hypothetical protein EVAR_55965_1 [Eumeta japonica]|uniref:Uncharacterized protein n=1 Tax=Eumeta variegata TaxID=151549 RepID=A0A4C1YRQ0_EUMVA|nr:hypothetical protein EVAR_55965_1 [Eumeta japonica]